MPRRRNPTRAQIYRAQFIFGLVAGALLTVLWWVARALGWEW